MRPACAGLVGGFGADVVIDYKTEAFDEVLSDYDIIFDMMGGETLNRSFKILKQGGTLVSIKGQDSDNLAGKYGVRFEWFFIEPDGAMLADLGALIKEQAVKPVIDSVYPMDETAKAYEALKDGHAVGKIVIAV